MVNIKTKHTSVPGVLNLNLDLRGVGLEAFVLHVLLEKIQETSLALLWVLVQDRVGEVGWTYPPVVQVLPGATVVVV